MRTNNKSAYPRTRSKVANGNALFYGTKTDKRTARARRIRDVYDELILETTGAGPASETQRQLCKQAAIFATELEQMGSLIVAGQDVDLFLYNRLSNSFRRLLASLGLLTEPEPEEDEEDPMAAILDHLQEKRGVDLGGIPKRKKKKLNKRLRL